MSENNETPKDINDGLIFYKNPGNGGYDSKKINRYLLDEAGQTEPISPIFKKILDREYNQAIEDAINVVRREPIGFAEFDFTVESILKSIQEKLTILKKINKP